MADEFAGVAPPLAARTARRPLVSEDAPRAQSLANPAMGSGAADAEFEGYTESVPLPRSKRVVPLFKALVVYLGRKPNVSLAMIGKVLETQEGDTVVKGVDPDGGVSTYDFALTDILGRTERPKREPLRDSQGQVTRDFHGNTVYGPPLRTADGAPIMEPTIRSLPSGIAARIGRPDLAGRPYCIVEHAEHLRQLQKAADETHQRMFAIFLGQHRAAFDEWVMRQDRRELTSQEFEDETVVTPTLVGRYA